MKISCALIMLSALMAPANALALSDLDTKFWVKTDEQGRERHLQCDLLTITNGTLICRNGNFDDRIPLSHVKQLDVEYMGKLYIVSDMNTDNINSANIMSANKEEVFSRQEKANRESKEEQIDFDSIARRNIQRSEGVLDTWQPPVKPADIAEEEKNKDFEIAARYALDNLSSWQPPDNKEAKGGWFKGWFGPSNYFECILDKMPGVKNDTVANETRQLCQKEFPNQSDVQKKSSIIGIKNSSECVLKYAKDETSPLSARLIKAACYKLYPKE